LFETTPSGPRPSKRDEVTVPCYSFRIRRGEYSGTSGSGSEFADSGAAWEEMKKVCGDLIGDVSRKLKPNDEWQIELLDANKKPVFRITLIAEALDK
jgi:uncharacterized protein DUF6894